MVGAFRNTNVNAAGQKIVVDVATISHMHPAIPTPQEVQVEQQRGVAREKMRNMAADIQKAMASLVKEGKVRITEGPQGISVEINASVLFAPGDAQLGPSAVVALQAVASVLAGTEYPITVEGHTDNDPIKTPMFPSNWELSVVRASSVVRLFQANGVAPSRLTASGYGEQRPVASNDTPEGRSRNRRVTLTIDAPVGPAPVPLPIQSTPATTPATTPAATAAQPVAPAAPISPRTPSTPSPGN
jgi:chemotaxis protein MotB